MKAFGVFKRRKNRLMELMERASDETMGLAMSPDLPGAAIDLAARTAGSLIKNWAARLLVLGIALTAISYWEAGGDKHDTSPAKELKK